MVQRSDESFRISFKQGPNTIRATLLGPLRADQNRALAEFPNPEFQHRENVQMPMTPLKRKFQIPSSKLQEKSQTSVTTTRRVQSFGLGRSEIWNLESIWDLVFGIFNVAPAAPRI